MQALRGLRVLVVEDQLLVAMEIEHFLEVEGCEVVGPASTVEDALALATTWKLDGALLDVNLQGKHILRVAEELERSGTPFVLVTGNAGREDDVPVMRNARRVMKPFSAKELIQAAADAFRR